MGRGKDTVRRHLRRTVLQLMKPALSTEFLTLPRQWATRRAHSQTTFKASWIKAFGSSAARLLPAAERTYRKQPLAIRVMFTRPVCSIRRHAAACLAPISLAKKPLVFDGNSACAFASLTRASRSNLVRAIKPPILHLPFLKPVEKFGSKQSLISVLIDKSGLNHGPIK